MPVVVKGATFQVEYQIPEHIDKYIPDYFYAAMAGELFSVFGLDWAKSAFKPYIQLEYDEEHPPRQYLAPCEPTSEEIKYDLDTGTSGWEEAFLNTCKKLDIEWFSDYYSRLDWYDKDIFDEIIETRIVKQFIEKPNLRGCSPYYEYSFKNNHMKKN